MLEDKFPYDFFKFNPANEPFEEVVARTIAMRDRTVDFFCRNSDLIVDPQGIIAQTIDQFSSPEDDIRIRASLAFYYQDQNIRQAFGDIYISNKPPTGATAAESACETASYWRMPYKATEFNQESLGEKKDHKELKTLIRQLRGSQYAIVTVDYVKKNVGSPTTEEVLASYGILPYTINPGTIRLFGSQLSGMGMESSISDKGFITNNCGSRFLSSCAEGAPTRLALFAQREAITQEYLKCSKGYDGPSNAEYLKAINGDYRVRKELPNSSLAEVNAVVKVDTKDPSLANSV